MISDGISSLEVPVFLLDVGVINMKSEVNLEVGFFDKSSLGQENDLVLMIQLWDVPLVGKGNKISGLRF